MKAKELMIGDLVHLYVNNEGITNEDVKVIGLSEDSITILNKFGIDEEYCEDDVIDGVSAITPILLTEEILKENGWEMLPNFGRDTYYSENGEFHLDFYEDKLRLIIHTHVIIIEYVHQLQQALRLCGLYDLADNFQV